MAEELDYVFGTHRPAPGEAVTAAPGVYWARMPLPFVLDHVNVWLLEDGDGWTVVDTGIGHDDVKAVWERVFDAALGGRPVKRVIVTHFHPDHLGLAGWLAARFGARLWMTLGEWAFGRMLSFDPGTDGTTDFRGFYGGAGGHAARLEKVERRGNPYPTRVVPIPGGLRRIWDGEAIAIGGRTWHVMVGAGHSPEHACLYCAESRVLISGDQILPRISPNISVWPQEPEADPLRLFLDSLPLFRPLPADTLVLPSHGGPFRGLHGRLDALEHLHDRRLEQTLAACAEPRTACEVLGHLFQREMDDYQIYFAIGETIAHLHFLWGDGTLVRTTDANGVHRFQAAG